MVQDIKLARFKIIIFLETPQQPSYLPWTSAATGGALLKSDLYLVIGGGLPMAKQGRTAVWPISTSTKLEPGS